MAPAPLVDIRPQAPVLVTGGAGFIGARLVEALGGPEQIDFLDTPLDIRAHYQYFTEANMARLKAGGYVRPAMALEDGVRQYVAALEGGVRR